MILCTGVYGAWKSLTFLLSRLLADTILKLSKLQYKKASQLAWLKVFEWATIKRNKKKKILYEYTKKLHEIFLHILTFWFINQYGLKSKYNFFV